MIGWRFSYDSIEDLIDYCNSLVKNYKVKYSEYAIYDKEYIISVLMNFFNSDVKVNFDGPIYVDIGRIYKDSDNESLNISINYQYINALKSQMMSLIDEKHISNGTYGIYIQSYYA